MGDWGKIIGGLTSGPAGYQAGKKIDDDHNAKKEADKLKNTSIYPNKDPKEYAFDLANNKKAEEPKKAEAAPAAQPTEATVTITKAEHDKLKTEEALLQSLLQQQQDQGGGLNLAA